MTETKKIDDGGPAFSGGLFEPQHGGTNDREPWNPGMSLRDWFAGQVLVAMGTWMPAGFGNLDSDEAMDRRAAHAYAQADALIAARKGGAA